MREIKCPNCGANIKSDITGRDFLFCEYCGTRIDLADYRSHIVIEDKAKIRDAEAREKIKLKELESKSTSHFLRNWMFTLLGLFICMMVGSVFSWHLWSLEALGMFGLIIAIPGGAILYLIDLLRQLWRRRK